MIHTHPRGFEWTTIDEAHNDPRPPQSLMDGYSDVSWDPVIFPTPKTMKAHCWRLDPRAQFESPAKVFAKLKANVGRNTGGMQICEKYGSVLLTPKKGTDHRPDEKWITHDTNTFDNNGAEALTVSSPKFPHHKLPKSFSNQSSPVKGTRHGLVDRNMYTPMKTLGQVSPQALLSHKATPSRSSNYIVRTPTKGQPQQPLHAEFGRRTRQELVVYPERYPLMSPAKSFANTAHACQPVRALDVDVKNEVDQELPGDESQSLISIDSSERDPCSLDEPTNRLFVNDVPYDQSPSAHCPIVSQDLWFHHSSNAYLSKRENLMSPAAKFSHMKQRKMQQLQEADNIRSNTIDHRTEGCEVPSGKQPASTDLDQEGIKYGPNTDAFVHLQRVCRFQSEGTRDPFQSSWKDDAPVPALKTLFEDPLLIQSPHVFFPKKTPKSIFKQNPASEEQSKPKQLFLAQKGGGYELAQWTIKFTREGLYVDGIRTGDNIPWHSTIIVERISQCILKTHSGRTYTLIGKMNVDEASKLPKWFLNKFAQGFPVKWKMHFQHFLSGAKTAASSGSKARQTKCPVSAKPTPKKADKKQRSPPFVTPSCPPPALNVSSFGLKTSRSGRLIKPPLEFWKGGRVSVDASMNVTIHEDYGTTVLMSPPKQQGAVFWRCGEALRHSESTARLAVDQQPLVLRRKVKPRSRNQTAKTHQPPKDQICPAAKRQPRAASSSPEEVEQHGARRSPKRLLSTREVAPLQTGCDTGRHKPTNRGLKSAGPGGLKSVDKPVNVAMMVETRSPEERQMQLTFQGCVNASSKKAKASKESTAAKEPPTVTACVGTLKRKQKMWSMSPSGKEQGFVHSDLEPMTPRGASYFTVKTPPCLHVTPGMTGSVTRKNDDKYNYHLQKRMKRRRVNACKLSPTTNFTLTPSVKQKNMDDHSFVIREMFPDNNGFHDDSGEIE